MIGNYISHKIVVGIEKDLWVSKHLNSHFATNGLNMWIKVSDCIQRHHQHSYADHKSLYPEEIPSIAKQDINFFVPNITRDCLVRVAWPTTSPSSDAIAMKGNRCSKIDKSRVSPQSSRNPLKRSKSVAPEASTSDAITRDSSLTENFLGSVADPLTKAAV